MIRYCGLRRVSQVPCGEEGWAKPAGWLSLPKPEAGSQEFYGLFAVAEMDDNYLALLVDGTQSYQVDWGDGVIETITAGAKAQHQYDFNDIPATTFYPEGGYRQVIVKVSMLNGGDMTVFSLDEMHDDGAYYPTPWLNINLDGPNVNTLELSPDDDTFLSSLRRAGLYNMDSLTSIFELFDYAISLQKLEFTGGAALTSITRLLGSYSNGVKELPLFDTSNVTTLSNPFFEVSLETYPLFDFSNVTTFEGNIGSYTSNTTIPAWDLSGVTSAGTGLTFEGVSRMLATGMRVGFTIGSYSRISRAGLVEMFNNLGTALGPQTITLLCNSAADLTPADIAIATGKGFTVA